MEWKLRFVECRGCWKEVKCRSPLRLKISARILLDLNIMLISSADHKVNTLRVNMIAIGEPPLETR